jgi:uncharacterized membrane protein YoaK (UPF0700 family)
MAAQTQVLTAARELPQRVTDDDETRRLERRLPPLLSVIAGMTDVTSYLTLGHVFTAHVTGNLVVLSALVVRGGTAGPAEILALPMFMLAVALVYVIARASHERGPRLAHLLLIVQLLLLAATSIVAVATRPSLAPNGMPAVIVAMIAVSAMACQYSLLRLAVPHAVSTAVMTGNLTNAVLSAMGMLYRGQPFIEDPSERLKASLPLLAGFVAGCVVAALAVSSIGDWTWALPLALSAVALAVR